MEALKTSITTQMSSVEGVLETAGVAIVGLAIVVFGFRWVKATFF